MKKNPGTDIFDTMVREAVEEVAKGGWHKARQKAVTLAAFGMMADKVNNRINLILMPAWLIALSVCGTALWYIISSMLGL